MPNYILVDDPLWVGDPPAPKTLRSWAMRSLFDAGVPIGDIARRYGVPYRQTYKHIHAPTVAAKGKGNGRATKATKATESSAVATKPTRRGVKLVHHTRQQLEALSLKALKQHALSKGIEADAYGELVGEVCDQRLGPGWWDG